MSVITISRQMASRGCEIAAEVTAMLGFRLVDREIINRAESEAGYLMAMPYTLALTVQALHGIFTNRGTDTGDYVIPVTMDTRPPSRQSQEVFFNHVSFCLFRIQACEVDDTSALLASIKQQMYDQAKTGLARHILDASLLMRIVPLPMVSYLLKLYQRCFVKELSIMS